MKKAVRSRGWCFTINNFTDDDIAYLMALYEEDTRIKYMILGFEEGSRKHTPHIQGYIYFGDAVSSSTVKKLMYIEGRQHHVEAQKAKKNVEGYVYCMEDGDYYEMGDRPRQGHRTDLEVIKHDIENGRPMKDIAKNYFSQWCQYRRSFDEYKLMISNFRTEVYYYDKSHPLQQMKKIRENYTDYYIVTDCLSPLELMKIISSNRYRYIFVPNLTLYDEYAEDFDGAIF